ncbi:MAG TPA: cytochrome c oxidase subunit 3 [Flavobacterium sp.]|nr:cytochrome c oxidase subunit 3 [Flavobacterium sp.]
MAMTIQEHKERTGRSYKLILWFAMISMIMMFAGLTSAYVISSSRPDWLKDFSLPVAFWASTGVILASSITFHMAKKAIRKDNRSSATAFLVSTFALGLLFVFLQYTGFYQLIEAGLYPTGPTSTVTSSFIFVVVLLHFVHLAGGLVSLLIIIYNHFKQKYNSGQTLGIELGATFWHFLDFLWLYLFLFLYFFK